MRNEILVAVWLIPAVWTTLPPSLNAAPWSQLAPCPSPSEYSAIDLELRKRFNVNLGLENPRSYDGTLGVRVLVFDSVPPPFSSIKDRLITFETDPEGNSEVTSMVPIEDIVVANLERREEVPGLEGVFPVWRLPRVLVEPPVKVEVSIAQARLPTEVAEKLRKEFQDEILGARYPRREEVRGVSDGVGYEFSTFVWGIGLICAMAHSPDEGTVARRLVDLAFALEAVALADEESRAEAIRSLEQLAARRPRAGSEQK